MGMAAELGHVTVDLNGTPCACGNTGCLEKHASATAVSTMARHLNLGENLTAREVYGTRRGAATRTPGASSKPWGRRWESAWPLTFRSSIFPLYLLSGGVLPAWEMFAPAMFQEVGKTLVHVPQYQDQDRESHARQRRGGSTARPTFP